MLSAPLASIWLSVVCELMVMNGVFDENHAQLMYRVCRDVFACRALAMLSAPLYPIWFPVVC